MGAADLLAEYGMESFSAPLQSDDLISMLERIVPFNHDKETLKLLETKLFDKLMSIGTLFGSRAWHVENDVSDYDLIVNDKIMIELLRYMKKNNIDCEVLEGASSDEDNHKLKNIKNVKIYLRNLDRLKVVNLLSYNDENIYKIEMVNELMSGDLNEKMKEKHFRNTLCEALVEKIWYDELSQKEKDDKYCRENNLPIIEIDIDEIPF